MKHKSNDESLNFIPDPKIIKASSDHSVLKNNILPSSSGSPFLIARKDSEQPSKEYLYQVLSPVFFGCKQAGTLSELAEFFLQKYGIDVNGDFFEGDEHYEEYQEACQAIRDGMSIYEGTISFNNCMLAELAETIWENLEKEDKKNFRRINTLLEE